GGRGAGEPALGGRQAALPPLRPGGRRVRPGLRPARGPRRVRDVRLLLGDRLRLLRRLCRRARRPASLIARGSSPLNRGPRAGAGGGRAPREEVVSEIKRSGGQAVANYDSVASMAGGQAIVKTALDAFGRVDVVVNNAGILRDRMIFNMTEEEWDAVINTHLKGSFAVTRAAAPLMREQKWGRFINMTSTSGLIGNVGQANYAAAKLGLVGLTKVTALDMARY